MAKSKKQIISATATVYCTVKDDDGTYSLIILRPMEYAPRGSEEIARGLASINESNELAKKLFSEGVRVSRQTMRERYIDYVEKKRFLRDGYYWD